MNKAPLAQVKERFGSKDKLVKAVRSLASGDLWIDRESEDGGLELASNAQLLHLHEVLTEVKEQLGSRAGLLDALLELENRTGDADYRARLEQHPTPRLWDQYRASKRRAAKKAAKAAKK